MDVLTQSAPYMPTRAAVAARFMAFVSPEPNSGCWLWTGCTNKDGYGSFRLGPVGSELAHRFAYGCFVGVLIPGGVVRHRCDVPGCVNPEHLLQGTQADNVADCVSRKRRAIGERNPAGAKITAATAREIRGMHAGGQGYKKIARAVGLSKENVRAIVRGWIWRDA